MKHRFEIFYQEKVGQPHRHVTSAQLSDLVGPTLMERAISSASTRMIEQKMPEVKSFLENGGRQLIVSNSTSRGHIYIEVVEILPLMDMNQRIDNGVKLIRNMMDKSEDGRSFRYVMKNGAEAFVCRGIHAPEEYTLYLGCELVAGDRNIRDISRFMCQCSDMTKNELQNEFGGLCGFDD